MNVRAIEIQSPFGVTVTQRFYERPADKLMVILPGRGYTVNHPVLSYLTFLGLENGYDVLPVTYGFQITGDFKFEQAPLIQDDVRLTVEPVLAERQYQEVCVVGKSLGTPLALDLARTIQAEVISQILLTPVGDAATPSDDIRTLAIIGTADPYYKPGMAQSTENVTWRVFENLDHGLIDPDDWRYSLRALEAILTTCEGFLQGSF
jgi:hypothetical protein